MDAKRFDKILHETVSSTVETLASKAKEYAKGDRLYNFKRAALILDTTPEKALAGMIAKHLVSVLDLIEGTLPATSAMLNEKIGDTINYLILLKALLLEKAANGFITSASVKKEKLFTEPVPVPPSTDFVKVEPSAKPIKDLQEELDKIGGHIPYPMKAVTGCVALAQGNPNLATKPATSCNVSVTPYQFNKSEEEEDAPIIDKVLPAAILGGSI